MKPFLGEPVKPAVDKLMETFKLKVNDVIQHEDIAHIIKQKYGSNRYRTLVQAWIRRVRAEQSLILEAISGIGYRVLNDNERVGTGIRNYKRSITYGGRALDMVAGAETKNLDESHRHQQQHAVRLRDVLEQARKAVRSVALAGRIVSLPRPGNGEEENGSEKTA